MFENVSPNTRLGLRVAAGIALGVAAGFATMLLGFVGLVAITGCFFECNEPDVLGGSLLLAAAVLTAALTVTSVVWGFVGWNRRLLAKVASVVVAVASLLVVVVAFFG